jgi:hypothetical protein
VTHWSSRRLADWLAREKKLQVSHDSITRACQVLCVSRGLPVLVVAGCCA